MGVLIKPESPEPGKRRNNLLAVLPPHLEVSLHLIEILLKLPRGYASPRPAEAPRTKGFGVSGRRILSAVCGGKAAFAPSVPFAASVQGPSSWRDTARLFLRWSLLLVFTSFFLPSSPVRGQDTPADNWSQFRGNQRLTGVSQSDVPQTLKQLWTYEAGDSIESSAAIVGGTVFVGSQKGELVALNLNNGAVFWKYVIDSPIGESSPAYSNGVVYIGDLGGWLSAVNATNGKKIWAFKAGNEIKSSPVVVGDRVLIGSYDQHLYCVSTRTGALIWKFRTNGPVHSHR